MLDVSVQSLTREDICSLLSLSDSTVLVELIDSLINAGIIQHVELIRPPATGTVQLQVREPICEERFIVGDALVTTAEVSVDGVLGWAMRLGSDAHATVAAAVADAHIAQFGIENVPAVKDLLLQTKEHIETTEANDWAEISGTVIDFEELD
jgi:alpha-D-ribose 1-methylphosphonate 5-triphosphate synthase subunit PhnG